MPRDGEKKWEAKTYTKRQLENIAGQYDSTPADVLRSGIASFILSNIAALTPVGLLHAAYSMSIAGYAAYKKAELQRIIDATRDGGTVTIEYEYRYYSQGKNKQGWVPTGEIRVA